ncbi:hypothetical protein DAI43_20965 [Achromobacter xylosoxidans]|nr:hypothetical protein DAI43_20965 [Achromobacter xylosoxidans]
MGRVSQLTKPECATRLLIRGIDVLDTAIAGAGRPRALNSDMSRLCGSVRCGTKHQRSSSKASMLTAASPCRGWPAPTTTFMLSCHAQLRADTMLAVSGASGAITKST